MIQRIQTLWLLFAVLVNCALFGTDIYSAEVISESHIVEKHLQITSVGYYPLLVLALVIIAMPMTAVFMFKNRKRQRNVIIGAIIAVIGFIALMLIYVKALNKVFIIPTEGNGGHYSIGAILPVISIIFLTLALSGVIKDDKLVKSSDRLR